MSSQSSKSEKLMKSDREIETDEKEGKSNEKENVVVHHEVVHVTRNQLFDEEEEERVSNYIPQNPILSPSLHSNHDHLQVVVLVQEENRRENWLESFGSREDVSVENSRANARERIRMEEKEKPTCSDQAMVVSLVINVLSLVLTIAVIILVIALMMSMAASTHLHKKFEENSAILRAYQIDKSGEYSRIDLEALIPPAYSPGSFPKWSHKYKISDTQTVTSKFPFHPFPVSSSSSLVISSSSPSAQFFSSKGRLEEENIIESKSDEEEEINEPGMKQTMNRIQIERNRKKEKPGKRKEEEGNENDDDEKRKGRENVITSNEHEQGSSSEYYRENSERENPNERSKVMKGKFFNKSSKSDTTEEANGDTKHLGESYITYKGNDFVDNKVEDDGDNGKDAAKMIPQKEDEISGIGSERIKRKEEPIESFGQIIALGPLLVISSIFGIAASQKHTGTTSVVIYWSFLTITLVLTVYVTSFHIDYDSVIGLKSESELESEGAWDENGEFSDPEHFDEYSGNFIHIGNPNHKTEDNKFSGRKNDDGSFEDKKTTTAIEAVSILVMIIGLFQLFSGIIVTFAKYQKKRVAIFEKDPNYQNFTGVVHGQGLVQVTTDAFGTNVPRPIPPPTLNITTNQLADVITSDD